ncbi:hypothetical protein [Sodalis glossinidius]|nr:hypothetical protein [Sodalis glossinidius]
MSQWKGFQRFANAFQAIIAGDVAVEIVILFEKVDVQQDYTQ